MRNASDGELFDAWREALDTFIEQNPTPVLRLWRKALHQRGYDYCPVCDLWLPLDAFVEDSGYCHLCVEWYEQKYRQIPEPRPSKFEWIRKQRALESGWL